MNEKVVRFVLEQSAGKRHINTTVNDQKRHVDALRAEGTGDGFGKNPLSGFGGRKGGKLRAAPSRRRIARHHDRALPGFEHIRCHRPSHIQQPHGVDLKVVLKSRRVNLQEGAKDRLKTDGVMNQDGRESELLGNGRNRGVHLGFIADVTRICRGFGNLPLKLGEAFRIAGQHGNPVATLGEPTDNPLSCSLSNAGDNADVSHHADSLPKLPVSGRLSRPLHETSRNKFMEDTRHERLVWNTLFYRSGLELL